MSWLTFSVDSFEIASFHNEEEVERFIKKNKTYHPQYFYDIANEVEKDTKFYHLCKVLGDLDDDIEIEVY